MTHVLTYLFERSLSPRLCEALRALVALKDADEDPIVVPHDAIHESEIDCDDDGAIAACSANNYVYLSCPRASRKKLITDQISAAGVRAVYLNEGFVHLPLLVQASKLIGGWEKLVRDSHRLKAGEHVSVPIR